MASWIHRLFQRQPAAATAEAPPAPAQERRSAPEPAAPPSGQSPTFGARRPLLDREGRLAGFEFSVGEAMAQRLRRSGDVVAYGAQAVALLSAMKPTLTAGRRAIARLPLAVLVRPQVLAQVPAGAMLVLTDQPFGDANADAALASLRQRGALLGAPWRADSARAEGAQFIFVDAEGLDAAALQAAARACRSGEAQALTLVASGIGSLDDLEWALRQGFDLASGLMDRKSPSREVPTLPPGLRRVAELLNLVMQNSDTAALAAELRNDVQLTYELLRHANGPLLGLSSKVEATDQAVMLLGRDALYRWLAMLLLAGARGRSTSRALQEVALARARLLELLAPAIGAPPPALFTTGMLSLLDTMLGMPMAVALEPLHLAEPARLALLEREGPWYPLLELAQALERSDLPRAQVLAAPLGGLERAAAAADDAWRWASAAAADLYQS